MTFYVICIDVCVCVFLLFPVYFFVLFSKGVWVCVSVFVLTNKKYIEHDNSDSPDWIITATTTTTKQQHRRVIILRLSQKYTSIYIFTHTRTMGERRTKLEHSMDVFGIFNTTKPKNLSRYFYTSRHYRNKNKNNIGSSKNI